MQAIQDVVEHLAEGYLAHEPSFGLAQRRLDMFRKLFLGYTGGDSAHGCELLDESFSSIMTHYHLFGKV
jgi:hypothetical protein